MPEVVTRPEQPRHPAASEALLAVKPEELAEARTAAPEVTPALPCANCGTSLAGPYCSRCGQHDKDYHRSLWRFLADFLDNTFCWDNKFLLTAKPLLRQPGFLTQEFMAGRRARYVHPLRLFLFTSAACLALIGFINHHLEGGSALIPGQPNPVKAGRHRHIQPSRDEPKDAVPAAGRGGDEASADDDTGAAPAASAAPVAKGSPATAADESLAAKIQGVLATSLGQHAGVAPAGSPAVSPGGAAEPAASSVTGQPEPPGMDAQQSALRQARRALRDSGVPRSAKAPGDTTQADAAKPDGPDPAAINAQVDAALAKRDAALAKGEVALASADRLRAQKFGQLVGRSFDSEKAGRIAEEISQGVEKKLSWVALALLPVFALLLRAVYWREDSYYFTHFVYSLHYHTFLFLFWAAYACAGVVAAFLPLHGLWSFLLGWCLLLPGWYLFLSLRRMYGESSRRTTAKVVMLGVLHLLAILIGVASVGALAFFSAPR